jgi:hypothetical protein
MEGIAINFNEYGAFGTTLPENEKVRASVEFFSLKEGWLRNHHPASLPDRVIELYLWRGQPSNVVTLNIGDSGAVVSTWPWPVGIPSDEIHQLLRDFQDPIDVDVLLTNLFVPSPRRSGGSLYGAPALVPMLKPPVPEPLGEV